MDSVYGATAVDAARACRNDQNLPPLIAWEKAIVAHTSSKSSREKSCPKAAFIGLCSGGFIKGILPWADAPISLNGQYASQAATTLMALGNHSVPSPQELWHQVVGTHKASNSQMHVVLALHSAGLLGSPL